MVQVIDQEQLKQYGVSLPVFMFSIQMASTGPSSTNHFLSGEGSDARFLNATASTPSFHSWVALSDSPAHTTW